MYTVSSTDARKLSPAQSCSSMACTAGTAPHLAVADMAPDMAADTVEARVESVAAAPVFWAVASRAGSTVWAALAQVVTGWEDTAGTAPDTGTVAPDTGTGVEPDMARVVMQTMGRRRRATLRHLLAPRRPA